MFNRVEIKVLLSISPENTIYPTAGVLTVTAVGDGDFAALDRGGSQVKIGLVVGVLQGHLLEASVESSICVICRPFPLNARTIAFFRAEAEEDF